MTYKPYWTPEEDAVITTPDLTDAEIMARLPGRKLRAMWSRRSKLKTGAAKTGATPKRPQSYPWTPAELALLEEHILETIDELLPRFPGRTVVAITRKRADMRADMRRAGTYPTGALVRSQQDVTVPPRKSPCRNPKNVVWPDLGPNAFK